MTRGAVLVFLNTVSADTLGLIIAAAGASSLMDNNGSLFSLAGVVWHRASVASFACASAHLLRRHLMVWAIFAPKLLFETLFFYSESQCISGRNKSCTICLRRRLSS